jgi:hypothetical protein
MLGAQAIASVTRSGACRMTLGIRAMLARGRPSSGGRHDGIGRRARAFDHAKSLRPIPFTAF